MVSPPTRYDMPQLRAYSSTCDLPMIINVEYLIVILPGRPHYLLSLGTKTNMDYGANRWESSGLPYKRSWWQALALLW